MFKKRIASVCLGLFVVLFITACSLGGNTQPTEPDTSHVHSFSVWTQVAAPSCSQDGQESRTCSCGETQTRTVSALPHSFGKWEMTKEPTCTEKGERVRTCQCGETEALEIDALSHYVKEWDITQPATCTEDGAKTQVCYRCKEQLTEVVPALGHTPGEWVGTDATCTEDGARSKYCTTCDTEVDAEVLVATGHTAGEWVVTAATCIEDGIQYQYCEVCNVELNTETIQATGHIPGEWVEDGVSCTSAGVRYKYCSGCDKELEREEVPASEHTPGEWVVTDATCASPGARRQYCTACYKELDSEEFPVVDHTPGEWVTSGVTCIQAGIRKQYCIVCEKELGSEEVPAAGHTPGEWVTGEGMVCTEGGTRYQYCEVCKVEVNSEAIAPADHTPGEWETSGVTCTNAGVRKQYCTVCKKELHSEEAPAAGHNPGEWETTGVSCTSAGVRRQYCTVCYKEVKSETVPASEHIPGEWVTTGVTCTKPGIRRQYCTGCGKELNWESVPATGHTPGDWVTADVTCTEGGTRYKYCEVCKVQVEAEKVAATGHTIGEWVTVGVSCTTAGTRSQYCTTCYKEINSEVIPATGHTPGEWVVTDEPGCVKDGMRKLFCTSCNSELDSEVLVSTGHNLGAWNYSAPTCTEIGGRYQSCTRCGERFYEDEEPMLGHVFDDDFVTDKEPTCAKPGSQSRHCTRCNEKTDVTEIPALGHDNETTLPEKLCEGQYMRHSCKRCNQRTSERLQTISAVVTLSYRKYYENGTLIQDIISIGEIKGGYGEYTITITYINPKGETVRYQIANYDGKSEKTIYLNETGWSIAERTAMPPFVRVEIEDEIGFKTQYECYAPSLSSAEYASGINQYPEKTVTFDMLATGHKETTWRVSKEATCTRAGQEQLVCTICQKVIQTKTIAAGHDYVIDETLPSCTTNGSTTVRCTKCTFTKTKDWTPVTMEFVRANYSSDHMSYDATYRTIFMVKNISGGRVVYDENGNIVENTYTVTIYNVDTQEGQVRENVAEKTGLASGIFADWTNGTIAPTYQIVVNDGRNNYVFYVWPEVKDGTTLTGIILSSHEFDEDAKCGRESTCLLCKENQYVPHEEWCGKCPKCEKTVSLPKIQYPEQGVTENGKKVTITGCAVGGYAETDTFVTMGITLECPKGNEEYGPLLLCDVITQEGWVAGMFVCDMHGSEVSRNLYRKTVTTTLITAPRYTLTIYTP